MIGPYVLDGGTSSSLRDVRPDVDRMKKLIFVAAVAVVAATPPEGRADHDPPPEEAFARIRLVPLHPAGRSLCTRVQARTSIPILCPVRLPRATTGWADRPPPKLVLSAFENWPGRRSTGISFSYGAPWEPGSGRDWRHHLWRNRPCCFLHFDVLTRPWTKAAVPAGAREAVVGGKRGFLKHATTWGMGGEDYLYFPNHARFVWRDRRIAHVATLHYFGRGTRTLLGRLIRELRPARRLPRISEAQWSLRGSSTCRGEACLAPTS